MLLAVPAFVFSLLIGLNPAFTAAILILFVVVSFTRFGRHPQAKFSKAEISPLLTALRRMTEFEERGGG